MSQIMQASALGQALLEREALTPEQLENALTHQADDNRPLGEILVEQGYVHFSVVLEILGEQLKTTQLLSTSRPGRFLSVGFDWGRRGRASLCHPHVPRA